MLQEYSVQLHDALLYRAIKIIRAIAEGFEKEKYGKLWDYCVKLLKSNPNSSIQLGMDRVAPKMPPSFDKLYICLDIHKKGLVEGYRPVIMWMTAI